jgi:hypothetical protein
VLNDLDLCRVRPSTDSHVWNLVKIRPFLNDSLGVELNTCVKFSEDQGRLMNLTFDLNDLDLDLLLGGLTTHACEILWGLRLWRKGLLPFHWWLALLSTSSPPLGNLV